MEEENMSSVFDIESQYQFYLKKVNLKEIEMSFVQRQETKRSYFAASAQMLLMFRDGIGSMENEDEAVKVMDSLFEEVELFWKNQVR